jgi:hypothetical protein
MENQVMDNKTQKGNPLKSNAAADPMRPAIDGLEAALERKVRESNPGMMSDPVTGNLVPIPSQQSESTSPPSSAAR